MRVVMNETLANRNRQITTWTFLATIGVLIGGFIFVNYSLFTQTAPPDYIVLLQAAVLPLAFVMTLVSVRMTNNWARRPFPEDALKDGMKSLSKRSVIYHYYHFPARHVLIAPQGVFAITTRWHKGKFTVDGDSWSTKKNAFLRFFSLLRMDGIGNPTQDAIRNAEYIADILKGVGVEDVEVHPLIVFLDEEAELEIGETPVPILYADESMSPSLNNHLRELNRQNKEDMQKKATLPLDDHQIKQFEKATLPETRKSKDEDDS